VVVDAGADVGETAGDTAGDTAGTNPAVDQPKWVSALDR